MEGFEKYLLGKRHFLDSMITIMEKQAIKQAYALDVLYAQVELIDDIIHHFGYFVKGESNG